MKYAPSYMNNISNNVSNVVHIRRGIFHWVLSQLAFNATFQVVMAASMKRTAFGIQRRVVSFKWSRPISTKRHCAISQKPVNFKKILHSFTLCGEIVRFFWQT
jgi:hypothetical protein